MTNYQSNSNASKEKRQTKKKIKPVVSNAKTKKKGVLRRMEDTFITDSDNAGTYIFSDLIVPTIKNTVIDIVIYLLGGDKDRNKSGSKTSYGRFYHEKDRNTRSTNHSGVFRYDDVVLRTRGDAESVLQAMDDILQEYPVVSVADLYELANTPTDNWAANKYGWTDIRSARVMRVSDGYLLRMPKPMPID